LPEKFIVRIAGDETQKFSTKGEFHDPRPAFSSILQKLKAYQDAGYPFASFHFDTVGFPDRSCYLSGFVRKGPAVYNGPVIIHGDSSISPKLISRWIRFRKDDPFSCETADRIPAMLRIIPFAEQMQPSDLEWFGNQAVLHVYLRKSGNNSFNGILGLLPGQSPDKTLLLTGNAEADFSNLFNRGLALSLQWSRFAVSSQSVLLNLKIPSLGYNGLGFSSRFELFRQDSLYFRQQLSADMSIGVRGLWQLRLGLQTMNSSQNQQDRRIRQQLNSLLLGLETESEPAGRISPQRRFFQARFLPGIKNQIVNGAGTGFTQIEFRSQGSVPVWHPPGRFWLRTSYDIGILSSNGLTLADQFRIGGLRSFRGFNENQFFTSRHFMAAVQPQFLLDSKFLLSLFCENLFYQSSLGSDITGEYRYALGTGIGAEWEAGSSLIQVSLASGFMKGLNPGLGTSKIHFGYVARF
jgi:outer membrane protein assembly factor BamA